VVTLGELVMILDLHRQGLSLSAIARRTGMDRSTIAKYVKCGLEPPRYGPRNPRPTVITPVEAYLRERIAAFPDLNGSRLLREIQERGYTGGYFLRTIRPAAPQPFERRFETPPGKQAQVDFAHFRTTFTDTPEAERIVWLFSLVLGHSRLMWARFVERQDLATVLRCHIAAFEVLGGAPAEILYDRMKTAVLGEVDERGIVYNAKLLDLAAHYGFVPKACKAYRAKTKGKVERPFRYVREDFFLGRSFRDLEHLNAELGLWLDMVANVRLHGTTNRIVAEAFAAEQPELQALPAGPFDALIRLERRVSHDGLVAIGGNYYSVPDRTRRLVEVHQLANEIRILDGGRLVARHPVMEGRKQYRIEPLHRQGAAARARAHSFQRQHGSDELTFLRPGERIAGRSLAIYQAIGDRLAAIGTGGRP
jgi:transposase